MCNRTVAHRCTAASALFSNPISCSVRTCNSSAGHLVKWCLLVCRDVPQCGQADDHQDGSHQRGHAAALHHRRCAMVAGPAAGVHMAMLLIIWYPLCLTSSACDFRWQVQVRAASVLLTRLLDELAGAETCCNATGKAVSGACAAGGRQPGQQPICTSERHQPDKGGTPPGITGAVPTVYLMSEALRSDATCHPVDCAHC